MCADPEALVPKLPKPKDLQPFPSVLALRFLGHKGAVRSLSTDPSGQWLLSGGEDGAVKLWEVRTGRCCTTWHYEDAITCVAWCPDANVSLAAIATGTKVVVLPLNRGNEDRQASSVAVLDAALESYAVSTAAPAGGASGKGDKEGALAFWRPRGGTQETASGDAIVRSETTDGGIEIVHRFAVTRVTWHAKGDYFCTVSPSGNTRAVLVHQLSRGASQNPFRKNRGRVVDATFHPTKPFFFVATQQAVRVYNLAKQALAKKLITGGGVITSLDVHPSGDHLIVGSEDRRLAWYDLDLSPRPYRALRYHAHAVRGTAFHRTYPLFASASDDATAHVFHGMVYADMMTNPLIVPVKILRGHKRGKDARGVLDVVFHPTQPWLFTAGADAEIHLYANP
jgi:ribosome biogenesis protein ERB1